MTEFFKYKTILKSNTVFNNLKKQNAIKIVINMPWKKHYKEDCCHSGRVGGFVDSERLRAWGWTGDVGGGVTVER